MFNRLGDRVELVRQIVFLWLFVCFKRVGSQRSFCAILNSPILLNVRENSTDDFTELSAGNSCDHCDPGDRECRRRRVRQTQKGVTASKRNPCLMLSASTTRPIIMVVIVTDKETWQIMPVVSGAHAVSLHTQNTQQR